MLQQKNKDLSELLKLGFVTENLPLKESLEIRKFDLNQFHFLKNYFL